MRCLASKGNPSITDRRLYRPSTAAERAARIRGMHVRAELRMALEAAGAAERDGDARGAEQALLRACELEGELAAQ